MDLPFTAEYALSSRSACKVCKKKIEKDTIRLGIMIQSPNFDGKIPLWHHLNCFWKKKVSLKSATEIANFDNLRWDDQKIIKEQIGILMKAPAASSSSTKNGKNIVNSDFSIEYAKSSRASCKVCGEKLEKGEVRISKLITDSPEAYRFGPMPGWHHPDCFVKARMELGFLDAANKIPGFSSLREEDQKMISGKLGKLKQQNEKREIEEQTVPPSKKVKSEDKLLKTHNDLLFKMRDAINDNLSKKEMIQLLEHNNQYISVGKSRLCDNLADCLVFGAIKLCPECKVSTPRFKSDAYRCAGDATEWTKCQFVTKYPARERFIIPEEFKEEYAFLKMYKYVKRERFFPEIDTLSLTVEKKGPLSDYIVAVFGSFKVSKANIEKKVLELGGVISPKVDNSVRFCISTEGDVLKNVNKVKQARSLNVPIVSPKFLEDIKKGSTPAVSIKENLICSGGDDPILKSSTKQEISKRQAVVASSSRSSTKSVSPKVKVLSGAAIDPDSAVVASSSRSSTKSVFQKVKVLNGAAVDPDSGMEDVSQVYQNNDNIYNAILGMVDLSRSINSFYKLQILERQESKNPKYFLFRAWGRIGTTIGKNKLEKMSNAKSAVTSFEEQYLRKTGNLWKDRKNFVKKPNLFYPLDIDYGQESGNMKELKASSDCSLPIPIQELICLIFDIEAMKKTMIEFEIDLKKMPLGKLSKNQIKQAYKVLTEAQQIIFNGCNSMKILDASNRFYTLIPHDFGLRQPLMLDNKELLKSKIEMLDSLLEIEFAYNMMMNDNNTKDPVSAHYEKLETDIEILEETSKEFKIIQTYVQNTHAETHNLYKLVLNRVFKINRHNESERYMKFKSLHNKKLLWHGSRLTNYVGILSQGLKIAPPEAPKTGYMFGKGIYFADMVSKSANYCYANKKNPTGILLLCEVALGDMYERTSAEFVTILPNGKHSVKGMGETVPDPDTSICIGDVEVPCGKPVRSSTHRTSLLYNEYIVYDVNQVNIKYLLDVTFQWKL